MGDGSSEYTERRPANQFCAGFRDTTRYIGVKSCAQDQNKYE